MEKTEGKFEIENINGGVRMTDIAGAGRVYALNGKVRVRFDANPGADCFFGSLNGNVEVSFRPQLSANVLLKTFNGQVYSDFPVSSLPPGNRRPRRTTASSFTRATISSASAPATAGRS